MNTKPALHNADERRRTEPAFDRSAHLAAIAVHFDARADQYALKYASPEPRHLFEHEKRTRLALAQEWIDQCAERHPVGKLLDVGCGDGQLIRNVLADHDQWRATGVDVSARMLHCAAETCELATLAHRVSWQLGSLTQVPGTYDAVVSLGVVGYQHDQSAFLRSLAARLRPGGRLIFTFANAQSYARRLRCAAQTLRDVLKPSRSAVRFDALPIREVDRCLFPCGLQRIATRWLCFGLGLPRSSREVQLSRWCEARWGQSTAACHIAQVALVCYQAVPARSDE